MGESAVDQAVLVAVPLEGDDETAVDEAVLVAVPLEVMRRLQWTKQCYWQCL